MTKGAARTVRATALGSLLQADALPWLEELPAGSVDLAVVDPPYGLGKAEWDTFPSRAAYIAWAERWLGALARALTPVGTAYVLGFSEILADVKWVAADVFPRCRWLVWCYRNKANLRRDWGRSHESILHLRKSPDFTFDVDAVRVPYNAHTRRYPTRPQGATSAFGPGDGAGWAPHPLGAKPRDVLEIPILNNGMAESTGHPTQKPLELVRRLVAASSRPGDLVLDPFAGSGTTAVVAELLGRRWIAVEREDAYVAMAADRLDAVAEGRTTLPMLDAGDAAMRANRGKVRG